MLFSNWKYDVLRWRQGWRIDLPLVFAGLECPPILAPGWRIDLLSVFAGLGHPPTLAPAQNVIFSNKSFQTWIYTAPHHIKRQPICIVSLCLFFNQVGLGTRIVLRARLIIRILPATPPTMICGSSLHRDSALMPPCTPSWLAAGEGRGTLCAVVTWWPPAVAKGLRLMLFILARFCGCAPQLKWWLVECISLDLQCTSRKQLTTSAALHVHILCTMSCLHHLAYCRCSNSPCFHFCNTLPHVSTTH